MTWKSIKTFFAKVWAGMTWAVSFIPENLRFWVGAGVGFLLRGCLAVALMVAVAAPVFADSPCPVNGSGCQCGCRSGQPCNCAADPVQSSVRVDVPYTDGTTHSGSGTVVALYEDATDRRVCVVLTNRHVCPKDCKITARWPKGTVADGHWLGADDVVDLAAFWCVAPADATECRPSVTPPNVGDELVQVGYSKTKGPIRRVGAALGGAPDFCAAITTDQGDSGSGLFDRRGRLVAVVWGKNLVTNQCTAVPLIDVHRFLLRPQTRYVFPELHEVKLPPRPVFAPFAGNCPGGSCRVR